MKRFLAVASLCLLSACGTTASSPFIPDKTVHLTSTFSIPLADVVSSALVGAAIYFIYDPLAPNWEVQEERVSEDTYRLDLRMKRYHTGGAGEAMQVLRRRAATLKREQGYGDYQLLAFSEGIESKTLGAQRVAEGTIKLVQRQGQAADSFLLNGR